MPNYRPLMCKAIVKIIKEKKTAGGIIMIDASLEHTAKEEGIILAIGTNSFDSDENAPKIGDKVAFARYGGKSLGRDGNDDEIRVIKDIDVLAIIED